MPERSIAGTGGASVTALMLPTGSDNRFDSSAGRLLERDLHRRLGDVAAHLDVLVAPSA